MEVFPPDDPQPEEVGNVPTQLEQMKAWDDFTKLEKVLQAACENNDVPSNVIETDSIPTSEIKDETSLIKSDIKRKWEEEITDSVESNSHKLKRINNLVLTSEVTIELVDPKKEKCDNVPISNLLTDIVNPETKPKNEEYSFSLQSDNTQIDSKNSLEFIKIETISEDKEEIHDAKNEVKENETNIFSDGGNNTVTENELHCHLKSETAQDVKNENSYEEKTIKNETNFGLENNAFVKSEDAEKFKPPESESMLTDSSSHTSDISNNLVGCSLSDDEDKISNHDNTTSNCTDSVEKKKDKKEKKEEISDKCTKKDDKLLKKKKFERCNIRDIKLEDELDAVTLSAQKEEQERIRRLQEAQMRALQERLQQIEVEKEALTQLFSQPPADASNLFDSTSFSESELSSDEKKTVKRENDVVLVESSEEDKAKLQTVIQAPTEDNIIDISSSSSGNESDSEDSEKKDDDIMVLSDEGEVETDGTAEDPNNSGAHTNDCFNLPDEEGRVLVNVGHPPEDPDIFLAPQIAKVIKPHQIGGIRFLYDNVVENLDRYKSSSGFGCILAHSMGLGKTVQVVSFVDVFLRHTPATLVLCIVPINTIQNWKAEFDMWVPPSNCVEDSQVLSGEIRPRDYNVYTLNENFKTMAARAALIAEWRKQGGVLLMGYEMYRMLALRKMPKMPIKKSKRLKKQELPIEPETNEQIKKHMDEMYEHIVIPGPDLVICDEGHRIKNSLASTSMALKSIKTRRRVVLTGYPLQNNLLEYWCMVDFVRPNYLGSRAEFCNMFERPISNGQCIDSTPRDRQLMRFRSHVLHSLLVGFVQRRGHSVLRAVLPKKEEHVLLIRMTPIQRQLYKCFVKDLLYVQQATNPLKLFAVCCKIWNHPDILYKLLQEKKAQEDIDLDIDISVTNSPALSGANCSMRKRGVGQNKAKMMQRPLKSLPKVLKVQPNLSMTTDSIKSEAADCSQGSVQQMSEDVKFNALDVCKNNYVMKSQTTPGHKDFSPEGSQQTFLNQFSKNTLPQSFCQTNYPQSSGKAYVSNPQNTNSYTQQSNIVSSRQFSTQASQQSLSQTQYPQSSVLQTNCDQSQNQFSQVQSQFNNESNELDKMNYPSSQSNFSTKAMQSFPSQSENNSHYSQQSETHKQFPQSLSHFSSQPDDNQDIHYSSSPQSSNQKFLQSSSYPHVSASQQTYGTQSEQQYSQQTYPTTSKQFNEEQSLQFSQQSPTGSTTHNSQPTPYPQMANRSPHASDRSSDHTLSSDSVYQPTPQHSQFSVSHPPQSYSESSPPLSQQQYPQQASFSQHPPSQQASQQPTSQSSVVQPQFSQSSSNQQMYSQYPQHSPEFSQTSSSQFQQQNLQPFPLSQSIQPQFAPNTQSYSETSPNYPPHSSPSAVSQQTFSQSFLQGGSEYSQQSSQQFSQPSSTNQPFSNSSLQQFNQQSLQTGNYVSNTGQQSSFPSQTASDGHLQFSQSPQSSGQNQICDSSVVGGNKQQTFSQTAYPSTSQQSSDSQYPQIGQSSGFDPQTSQSNTFPQTPGNTTQYTSQSSEQFSQQTSNSNQFHQQSNNQTQKYSQQTSQFAHQPSTQQYAQQVNQSSNYSQQSTQNSQLFSQQTASAQYTSSPPKSPFKQNNQSQISVPSNATCYQPVSQTSTSQQSTQNISQFSQVASFPQQPSQVQSFPTQGSQYHQQSVQSSQQFNHATSQSPQQYLQHPAQSPKQFNQHSNQSSQYSSQVSPTTQSPQNFSQQSNQAQEFAQQPNQSSIQAHNNQQSQSPQQKAPPPFNASQHKSSQQFSQQQSQSSPEFNQLENLNAQQVNQTSASAIQLSQPPNQSSQQFSQQEGKTLQLCNQQTVQNSQHYSQQTNQASQMYSQQTSQSPQQFNQPANQVSPHTNQQASQSNHQYTSNNPSSQNCNEQTNLNQPYNISANQTNQMYSSSHQTYNQQVEPSQTYVQQSGQTSQQYTKNGPHTQQFNQHSNQTSPQYTQKLTPNSQTYTQVQCQSSQQYSQQPSQSQQFNHQPAQSPQFTQPVQSPLQYSQQPAQSPKQYSQQTVQSPQQFPQQPVQSPQQFTQQPVPSPQQFSQQPSQSPQQFSQQAVQSPQHFTQPVQSPQHFTQPVQSPQQFCQQQIPSPQQFSQLTSPSSQQFSQPTTPSPQQFSQPTTPSPQQFSQPTTPSPQQFSQPAAPSPQQFTQQTVSSPQQFNQQATHSPQFNPQPIPSPQQFPQGVCSPQQFQQQSSQSVSTQQFPHQSTPTTTQSFSQLANSPYKQPMRSGQTASFSVPQQQSVQSSQYSNSFSQPVNQGSVKGSFQVEYPNQLLSNSPVPTTQSQSLLSQINKSTQRGTKSKQSRTKTLGPPLLPQSNIQHSVKQPPSFSVQAFQNGNPTANVSQKVMGHNSKQFPNSVKSTFQPLNASLSNHQNYSIQHIKQDSTGVYTSKCSKAVLQPMNCQGVTHDTMPVQQQQMQPNQLKSDSSVMDSDQQSNSVDTAVAPFRERIDSSINYEWAVPIMKDYVLGVLENSHKMMVLFVIIAETLNMGDKLLVFSQSLSTLDLLEHFLSKIQIPKKIEDPDHMNETWCRNKNYFRLDGSTSAQEREKLINEFNRNDNVSLFLLSTRAGCLGINLVGANRIVVMDASWNPCHDAQAVCRIYRYGQKKQCHIYRLVTDNSLEKRIYDRQVNKQGMSDRVVDELNPESNFTWKDVTTLIQDDEDDGPVLELSKFASSYSDRVLKYLVSEMSPSLSKEPFEHESLLLDRKDLKLTKQEKRLAKQSYEMAKRANMINIRTTYTYLPAGAAGGGQFIINNKQCQWVGGTTIRVLPNQSSGGGALRSGTTATPITASQSLMSSLFKQGVMVQKLTMPSNVSIPVLTPGAPPVVIPAGQDVLVLRTPKGVYLRLPDGRIIAVQLPPSLLAKTQFRPNVVTHFRPAAPKGGNASTTVINTPRGQSIGIIKQTLQCGGTVRYLGPRSAAGSTTQNTRSSAPEVIDLSDDDEPSSRKAIGISNTSANSSESESGEQDKNENVQTNFLPGKQITIRKISPSSQQNSFSVSGSKEKCELPQMLAKNKQITILPVNPNTQQNRQKIAPQLAQPVRVQQMLLQPQQGKRKPTQKTTAKIQMTPLLSNKNVRPQITITQPMSAPSNITSSKLCLPNSTSICKSGDLVENMNCDSRVGSPTKQNVEPSSVQLAEKNQSTSLHSLQISKNISISVPDSGKFPGNMMPQSLASISTMLNPSLQITPANSEKTNMSDLSQQKTSCHSNLPNISITPSIQNQTLHTIWSHSKSHKNETTVAQSTTSQTFSTAKSDSSETGVKAVNSDSTSSSKSSAPQLISSSQSFFQQTNVSPQTSSQQLINSPQTSFQLSSSQFSSQQLSNPASLQQSSLPSNQQLNSNATAYQPPTALPQSSVQQLTNSNQSSFQQSVVGQLNFHQIQQKHNSDQQPLPFSSQNSRLTLSSNHIQSQSSQLPTRKRKSANKQTSKKSQQQHSLMTQNHVLQPPSSDTSQSFLHSQISDHMPENHFLNFPHHMPSTDFQPFTNFSSHKPLSHIQHPQPLHPLQHGQEHTLSSHLAPMSHLYVSPHLAGTSTPLPDMQPSAPRAWPVPQTAGSSFHPFSQSSPYYSSGQETNQFSFQPSSFPLPPSSIASNIGQSESHMNSESGGEQISRINSSDL